MRWIQPRSLRPKGRWCFFPCGLNEKEEIHIRQTSISPKLPSWCLQNPSKQRLPVKRNIFELLRKFDPWNFWTLADRPNGLGTHAKTCTEKLAKLPADSYSKHTLSSKPLHTKKKCENKTIRFVCDKHKISIPSASWDKNGCKSIQMCSGGKMLYRISTGQNKKPLGQTSAFFQSDWFAFVRIKTPHFHQIPANQFPYASTKSWNRLRSATSEKTREPGDYAKSKSKLKNEKQMSDSRVYISCKAVRCARRCSRVGLHIVCF